MIPPAETLPKDFPAPKKGVRQTEQRKAVFEALMAKADHPNAVDVFMRVKGRMPSISLATVYNCLETLTTAGFVRTVNHDREPSRYCANLTEHAHLFCTSCNSITDIPLQNPMLPEYVWDLPPGITIARQEVSFQGLCAQCASPGASPGAHTATSAPAEPSSQTSPPAPLS